MMCLWRPIVPAGERCEWRKPFTEAALGLRTCSTVVKMQQLASCSEAGCSGVATAQPGVPGWRSAVHCCALLRRFGGQKAGLVFLHVFVAAGEPLPLGMQAGAALPDVPLSQLSQAL